MNDESEDANLPTMPTPEPPSWSSEIDEFAPIHLRFELEESLVELELSDGPTPLKLDNFTISQSVGSGAMGEVYLAEDVDLGREVALKVVRFIAPDRAHLQQRLLQEARALSLLSHPNVVQVYGIKRARSGERVIALEYIDGPTVRQWQRERSFDRILDAYLEIAHGLAEAHRVGVIHRDFKPDNALVRSGETERVVVVDFGLAGGAIDADRSPEDLLSPIESTGLGTPEYMAPEQLVQPATAACDQYAFCVSLWEAVDGRRPFGADRGPVDEVPPAPPSMPAWLYWVLRKGLAWDPQDRFANMAGLIRWLEYGRSFRTGLRWAAAAGVVLIVLLGIVWAVQPPPCASASADIDEVWSDSVRAELERSVAAIDEPWASRASDYALDTLDDIARTWSDEAHAVCEAEQREGPSAELDRRAGCLEHWLSQFRSTVDLLRSSDPSAAEHVVEVMGPLAARADLCHMPPPALESRVRAKLAEVETKEAARRLEAALVGAHQAVELAEGAEPCREGGRYSFEAAAADFRLGHVLGKLERWDESRAALARASSHALSCGDAWTAFEIRRFQGYVGIRARADEVALATARLDDADALLEPIVGDTGPSSQRAEVLRTRGLVLANASDPQYERAIELLTVARDMFDEVGAPLDQRLRVRHNLGSTYQEAEVYGEAGTAYRDAKQLLLDELGHEHPSTARVEALIEINEGLIALERADYDDAERSFSRAARRGDAVVVAKAYSGWIQARTREGQASRSIPLLRRYQRWLSQQPDLSDELRAESLYVMGQMLTQASLREGGGVERPEDFETGLDWLRDAEQLWAEVRPELALTVRVIVASSLYEAMRHDEAAALLDTLPLAELPEALQNNVSELRKLIETNR